MRETTFGMSPAPDRIKIRETVYGEGPETADAMQNLLDRMERRCAGILSPCPAAVRPLSF